MIVTVIRVGTRVRLVGPNDNREGGGKSKGRLRRGRKHTTVATATDTHWPLAVHQEPCRGLCTQSPPSTESLVNIIGVFVLNVCRSPCLHRSRGDTAASEGQWWWNVVGGALGESRGREAVGSRGANKPVKNSPIQMGVTRSADPRIASCQLEKKGYMA